MLRSEHPNILQIPQILGSENHEVVQTLRILGSENPEILQILPLNDGRRFSYQRRFPQLLAA